MNDKPTDSPDADGGNEPGGKPASKFAKAGEECEVIMATLMQALGSSGSTTEEVGEQEGKWQVDEQVRILLVEDNELDAQIFLRGMKSLKMKNKVDIARNGIEALEILRGTAGRAPLPRPNIVILDVNMPRMNGHEFLTELRQDEQFRDQCVFVLSTSDTPSDKLRAHNKNVAGYICKKISAKSLIKQLEMLREYWRTVDLPS